MQARWEPARLAVVAPVDDLLKPTLDTGTVGQATIYSTTAGFATSFFGGPFAAITLTGINAWRLRRLAADALPLLGATALSVLVVLFIANPAWFGQPDLEFSRSATRLLHRAYALGLFGAFWLLHRRFYRGMAIMGLEAPNGWIIGIACVLLGVLMTSTLIWAAAR